MVYAGVVYITIMHGIVRVCIGITIQRLMGIER